MCECVYVAVVLRQRLIARNLSSVSTDDLRDLVTLRTDTLSDTLDSLNLDPKVPLCSTQVFFIPLFEFTKVPVLVVVVVTPPTPTCLIFACCCWLQCWLQTFVSDLKFNTSCDDAI